MRRASPLPSKDYRIEGPGRYKTMTLAIAEFIRRFLMHVLPKGFHRIRHALDPACLIRLSLCHASYALCHSASVAEEGGAKSCDSEFGIEVRQRDGRSLARPEIAVPDSRHRRTV